MNDYDLLKDDVYSIRTEGHMTYRVTKFNKELNPVIFYQLKEDTHGGFSCNCPQSNRGACKHLDIMDAFATYPERIDKGWFFCQQTGDWFPPVRDAEQPAQVGDAEQGVQLSRREPVSSSGVVAPPPPGGGEADLDPSTASPITPEVEATPPPRPPSGVMTFSEPLKRRI